MKTLKKLRAEPVETTDVQPKQKRSCFRQRGHLPQGVECEELSGFDLSIKKIETSKDKIEQPALARHEHKIMPSLGHSVIINGMSGSGKSTLLANYITGPQFFGKCPERPKGWFDEVFLFSPTAGGDDIQRSLNIKESHVYTDMDEAPELLRVILDSQKNKLKGGGKAHKVPQYCVIFDDVIGETSFLGTNEFLQTFYMVRHRNCTTFICSQHYKRVPKVCRLQAGFIHFFAGSQAEVEQVVEDFSPPEYTKNEFRELVNDATRGDHAFLTICMKVGWEYRFRQNLGKFFVLTRLRSNAKKEEKKESPDTSNKPQQPKEDSPEKGAFCEEEGKSFKENLAAVVAHLRHKYGQHEQTGKVIGHREDPGSRN
jgi:hypothetical protein